MQGYTLDAGALIALERKDRGLWLRLDRAGERGYSVAIPAGVLAQVWRDGRTQAGLARLIVRPEVQVVVLDEVAARAAGKICGSTGTSDLVDASVVLCAHLRQHQIITSDPEDLARLNPKAQLIVV